MSHPRSAEPGRATGPDESAVAEALAGLVELPAVADAVHAAREACTALRWHEALRRRSAPARAEATIRAARSSAALDGARYPVELIRDAARGAGSLPDDASGRLAEGAIRVLSQAGELEGTISGAPAQALARLQLAAAAGLLPADQLGRPRLGAELPGDGFGDPGAAPAGAELAERLAGITALLAAPATAPALIVAALVHAELITVRPFIAGNGLVARAAARAVIIGRGLDPTGVVIWEAAHLAAGPGYPQALLGYASGRAEGVAGWLVHCADAVVTGAAEGRRVCDAVLAGRSAG